MFPSFRCGVLTAEYYGADNVRVAQPGDLAFLFDCEGEDTGICMLHFYRAFEDEDIPQSLEHMSPE